MRYIVFEGRDGSGKSTLVANVAAMLSAAGFKVASIQEPTAQSQFIKQSKLSALAREFAFLADRAELFANFAAFKDADFVLSDRSFISHLAYSSALSPELLLALNLQAVRGILPEAVVFLDIDSSLAQKRLNARNCLDEIERAPLKIDYASALKLAQDLGVRLLSFKAASKQELASAVVAKLLA